jgi:hypothetical protein
MCACVVVCILMQKSRVCFCKCRRGCNQRMFATVSCRAWIVASLYFSGQKSRVGVVCVTCALHVTLCVYAFICVCVCVSGKTCVHASVVCACKCCANFQVINFECVAVCVRYWLAINNWM